MYSPGDDGWRRIELLLLRLYLLLHMGSGLIKLILRDINETGHGLSLW